LSDTNPLERAFKGGRKRVSDWLYKRGLVRFNCGIRGMSLGIEVATENLPKASDARCKVQIEECKMTRLKDDQGI